MRTSYNFADAQRLLVKPFERPSFIITFVLATVLSQIVAHLIASQSIFALIWEKSQIGYGIATGIISGALLGAFQWLILRKYISDWRWILVVGLSEVFMSAIETTLDMWKEAVLLSGTVSTLEVRLATMCVIGLPLIAGYLQWYVLRPHITKARWWIFIPLIAALMGVLLFSLMVSLLFSFGLLARHFPQFSLTVINLTMLPATQAIGFCILKKKFINDHPVLQTHLALAPDIVNYQNVQMLERSLYTTICRAWKTDLSTSIRQLTYLVGVNHNAAIITYEPMDQASVDNVDQTPLPELAASSRFTLDTENPISFAKFQIVVTPPVTVRIDSWRGIPLIWLAVAIYAGIVVISALCAWLQIDILPFGNDPS